MSYYFDDINSIYTRCGDDTKRLMNTVARKFMGDNPAHAYVYKAYNTAGIVKAKDYRYEIDLNKVFPDSKDKDCVWAWAKYYSQTDGFAMRWTVNCYGPMTMWLNDEQVYKSDIFRERYSHQKTTVDMSLKKGWNNFVICFKKTKAGFGGKFGSWLGKHPITLWMPTSEREGQEGWIYSEIVDDKTTPDLALGTSEKDTGLKWFPENKWDSKHRAMGCFERLYGEKTDVYALGWTKVFFNNAKNTAYKMRIKNKGKISVFIGSDMVYFSDKDADSTIDINIRFGKQDVIVKSESAAGWGYELSIDNVEFINPCNVHGSKEKWIYLGTFDNSIALDIPAVTNMRRVAQNNNGGCFWRLDEPNTVIRPYNDNNLYGLWNYPLGVTLYGMLHAAKALNSTELQEYVKSHVQLTCDTFDYAMWDKEQYGGATPIHHLLTSIDSLDDCGSFGSLMLEVAKYFDIPYSKEIADYIADYISNKQIRLEDGTFFRKNLMHTFHEDTMWADDLYMSVPFLCRYYKLTGDARYVNDAAKQFLGFKKKLFMPEENLMSHVYDFTYDTATFVPWGRGNGWVGFSLSELLEVLPQEHELRPQLLDMFKTLCSGYLKYQDENGMWHQVVNDLESYPETSCTSMFIYSFSRGIRFGWLTDNTDEYIKAVYKGWTALSKTSVDASGNVYGVCRGSEFSFIPDYYKYELLPNFNDTHGVGIVLLAGVETDKLTEFLNKNN